jgi:hypothetical protein
MKHLMIALALTALTPIAAHSADRTTVAEQVAAKCRKDYPDDYTVQLVCRMMQMEAFDKLEQQDQERASRSIHWPEPSDRQLIPALPGTDDPR